MLRTLAASRGAATQRNLVAGDEPLDIALQTAERVQLKASVEPLAQPLVMN